MNRPLIRLCFAPILVAAVLVGCGSDSGTEDFVPTVSRENFIVQADFVCLKGNEEINSAAELTASESGPSAVSNEDFVATTIVPNMRGQLEALRELTPPEGDEDIISELWDTMEAGIVAIEADPTLALGDNPTVLDEFNTKAEGFGLRGCGASS